MPLLRSRISVLLASLLAAAAALSAQTPNQVTQQVDTTQALALANHVPAWANAANLGEAVPAALRLNPMTIVLARSPQQELAFEKFLADQQDPTSPVYHQWLTPVEVGERFGLSTHDIQAVTDWLYSQGLQVSLVSAGRTLITFNGAASDVGRAFQTELRYYNVNGAQRMSVASDPKVPAALAPVIKAVRGLSTIEEKPQHVSQLGRSDSPNLTASVGSVYFMAPADFDKIYDVPTNYTGAGVTIGIVAESRTNFADFANFRALTGATFANPTEVIPTAYGGVDPGPAYTAPPAAGVSIATQGEATLDVIRTGSVAPGANLLSVVATTASGGIGTDAEYLIDTTPVPAKVISISFGGCEYLNGSANTLAWDSLFQQAAAEGISVFVSSGDSGASGCDANFSTPPASPYPNSPNNICSSSYATCVGGTEFNDASNYAAYWSSSNSTGYLSALGYIPEGGWNEPYNANVTPNTLQVASSGGGVSAYIATPTWQTGTGVPAARAGRYTPDVSFSSSLHDGYFGCEAAGGGSCVVSGGSFYFVSYGGTSAAAPGMAGVAALLDQKLGSAQGNLNPGIYQLYNAGVPSVFHDVTVATSGVSSCVVTTPSMCNNSIPSPTALTGGQSGYLVTTGYDEVTGLGSIDVGNFIANFTVASAAPTITFSVANHTYGNPPFTVSATSNSTGAFTYSVTSGPATISGSTVTLTGAGTVVLLASEAAAGSYAAGTQSATFTVAAIAPTITFAVANQTFGAAPFAVSATSNSAGAFTYSVVSGPATISGATVTLTGAGTVVLQASEAAAGGYSAATQNASFTVAPATPTIAFTVPNQTYGTAPFTVSASSNSTGAFTYSVVSGPATIAGSTVTLTGVGTVVVQASQAAAGNYTAGTQNATFTVGPPAPTIVFTVPNHTYGDAPFTVSATSNSTGAFTYSVTSGPATISGSTVTLTGAGTVVLLASEAAAGNYAAGTQSATFTVNGVAPTIVFSVPNHTFGDAPFTVTATSNSSGAFTYSVVSGPATIAGSTVTLTGSGTVVLQASEAASGPYNAGSLNATFTVAPAAPTIVFTVPNQTYGSAPFAVSATSNSTGAFTYSVTSGPATISGSTVTLTGVGTVVLLASEAAAGSYTAGSKNATFTVAAGAPTITFTVPNQTYGTPPFAVTATSNSTGAITYSVASGPATISGATVTLTGLGTVVLLASQAASANFTAGTQSATFTVKIAPSFSLTTSASTIFVQNAITFTATLGSAVGTTPTGSVTFLDSGASIGTANLSAGVALLSISTLAAGPHTITAMYAGDTNFLGATTLAVTETVQDFTFVPTGSSSQTVQPGATATYSFPITLSGGTTLPAAITFSASGVPTGATATFTPGSLASGSPPPTAVSLAIVAPQTAMLEAAPQLGRRLPLAALALLLLPFAGKVRRSRKWLARLTVIALMLAGAGSLATLTGCGSKSGGGETGPQTYNITATATSGTLTHSTTLTLTVNY